MAKFAKHMQSFQVQPPSPSVSSLVPSDDVDSMQLLTNMSAILSPCLAGAAGTDDDHLAFITNIHNHAALCEPNHDLHSPLFHSRPSVPDLPATWVAEALPPVFDEQVFINMPTPLPDNHVRCSDQKRKVLQLSPESSSGIVSSSPPSPPALGKKKKSDDPSTESLERGKRRKSIDKEENPKDVVHVRARRGQATDSHSLAERVRRGKINEKLRHLQAIVPGCYKAMGMASMLGEIINYVQSLQHQVEFLSMKLAAASLHHDFNSEQDDAMQAGQGAQSYYGDKELHVRLMMRHANFSSTLPNLDFTF